MDRLNGHTPSRGAYAARTAAHTACIGAHAACTGAHAACTGAHAVCTGAHAACTGAHAASTGAHAACIGEPAAPAGAPMPSPNAAPDPTGAHLAPLGACATRTTGTTAAFRVIAARTAGFAALAHQNENSNRLARRTPCVPFSPASEHHSTRRCTMQSRFMKSLEAMHQAQQFLDRNASAFADINGGGARSAFNDAVAAIADETGNQGAHRVGRAMQGRSEAQSIAALRRNHIGPIVRVARMLDADIEPLREVAYPSPRLNAMQLAVQALTLATIVEPYIGDFVGAGLKASFIADLRNRAQEILGTNTAKGTHFRRQINATASVMNAVLRARRVTTAIDALVRADVRRGHPLEAEWDSIVRAIRSALRNAVNPEPAAATPAAAAAPQPVNTQQAA
jgi:hypothetical protein